MAASPPLCSVLYILCLAVLGTELKIVQWFLAYVVSIVVNDFLGVFITFSDADS